MKLGLISDIHGNHHALTVVHRALVEASVDLILCAGDLVGYGAQPNSVIQHLQEANIPCVAGNYDEAVAWDLPSASKIPSSPRNEPLKQAALDWAKQMVANRSRHYLMSLPFSMFFRLDGLTIQLVHAGPDETVDWYTPAEPEKMAALAQRLPADVIVLGHTHQQFVYTVPSQSHGETLIINPGAVGRALDGDTRAAFAIFDTATDQVTPMRVTYDLEAAVQTIYESEMPDDIARLISHGARRIEELDAPLMMGSSQ